jgi:hypothetical protein
MKSRILRIGMCICVLGLAAQVRADFTYNAADDFSATSNPNGVWSYGAQSSTVPFTAYTTGRDWGVRTPSTPGIECWDNGEVGVDAAFDPGVTHNSTADLITAHGYRWPANALVLDLHGSTNDTGYANVRWTAPTAGVINVSATFTDTAVEPGVFATPYVRINGGEFQSLGSGAATSTGVSWSSTGMEVMAGNTIDFLAVGNGGTLTRLDATITMTTVPEPSAIVLLGSGILGLLAYAWRKRSKLHVGLLALGVVVVFAGSAAATDPDPIVYLKMNGNLNNSGTGGSAYNGYLESVGSNGGTPLYVTGHLDSGALDLNPGLEYTQGQTPIPVDNGNNVAIPYTLSNSGTIAMWYNFPAAAYDSQQLFNNSASADVWEGWASKSPKVGARITDLASDPGTGTTDWAWNGNATVFSCTPAEWHHVAFTWNRHLDNPALVDAIFYLDGAVATYTKSGVTYSGNRPNRPWADPGETFYLGGNHGNTNANGFFDEVRIYDVQLSAGQIGSLLTVVPEPGTCALLTTGLFGLLAYAWRKRR